MRLIDVELLWHAVSATPVILSWCVVNTFLRSWRQLVARCS